VIAVGLMSGTSLDGVDAALVEIVPRGAGYRVDLLQFETVPFDTDLRRALSAALAPNEGSIAVAAALHRALGETFGRAALSVAGRAQPRYVASHGQTVWHDGRRSVTLQLGDAFAIREIVRATVCYDFRSADCAAGGQGAPLVPYADVLLFGDCAEDRVALNLGGIANVTLMPAGAAPQSITGFDTGPANMLLDALVRERTGGAQAYDRDGAMAASGAVDTSLLEALLADDYFAQTPPKTTGRERFGAHFLARHSERIGRLRTEDALATLVELTAATVAEAVAAAGLTAAHVIVAGGGARNAALMRRIAERLPDARLETSDAMGIAADAKEAVAFALLGYETLRGRTGNVPAVTGASHAVVLGAIAPRDLTALLAEIASEVAQSAEVRS